MMSNSIGGKKFKRQEILVRDLLPGSRLYECKCSESKKGDIKWGPIDIEVKGGNDGETITLNQIRSYRGKILVAVVDNKSEYKVKFIVYPPDYIIKYYLTHTGQSTPDGMLSSSKKPSIYEVENFGCNEKELPGKIRECYEKYQNCKYEKLYADFTENMINVKVELNKFYNQNEEKFKEILSGSDGIEKVNKIVLNEFRKMFDKCYNL